MTLASRLPELDVVLMGFSQAPGGADTLAELVKAKGRCLAPGETPPPWPKPH